jgi:hypothetical protein
MSLLQKIAFLKACYSLQYQSDMNGFPRHMHIPTSGFYWIHGPKTGLGVVL